MQLALNYEQKPHIGVVSIPQKINFNEVKIMGSIGCKTASISEEKVICIFA